ncbi:hypothetical protein [Paenibacillus paeoniae]|uniref:Alpha/beta hydrolase n=1 Tax=Paenibacillus paeoniae TaxID=2292705 RepID=A0A371P7N3_9BACL|nr:hypothetical protein [Paenibacillus paeoniae]REK71932.1 hypothetical protein DX130_19720 [Paenibacillus paeoniae]
MKRQHTYNQTVTYWKQYQKYFPEEMRVTDSQLPKEEWMVWNEVHIHLDRMPVPDAKLKVICIHEAGGNGRLLAPYARKLQQSGYEVVSPDMPPNRPYDTVSLQPTIL